MLTVTAQAAEKLREAIQAQALGGMVIDCQETPQGVQFSISKLAPDT